MWSGGGGAVREPLFGARSELGAESAVRHLWGSGRKDPPLLCPATALRLVSSIKRLKRAEVEVSSTTTTGSGTGVGEEAAVALTVISSPDSPKQAQEDHVTDKEMILQSPPSMEAEEEEQDLVICGESGGGLGGNAEERRVDSGDCRIQEALQEMRARRKNGVVPHQPKRDAPSAEEAKQPPASDSSAVEILNGVSSTHSWHRRTSSCGSASLPLSPPVPSSKTNTQAKITASKAVKSGKTKSTKARQRKKPLNTIVAQLSQSHDKTDPEPMSKKEEKGVGGPILEDMSVVDRLMRLGTSILLEEPRLPAVQAVLDRGQHCGRYPPQPASSMMDRQQRWAGFPLPSRDGVLQTSAAREQHCIPSQPTLVQEPADTGKHRAGSPPKTASPIVDRQQYCASLPPSSDILLSGPAAKKQHSVPATDGVLAPDGTFHLKPESFLSAPKVYSCDICSATFGHGTHLRKHYLRLHISRRYIAERDMECFNIDPEETAEGLVFRCHNCVQCFPCKAQLRTHLSHHPPLNQTQHKPPKSSTVYKCKYCVAVFKWRKQFGRHKKLCKPVSRSGLHHCLYCNETFLTANKKRNHILSYHPYLRRRHSCVVCNECFSSHNGLFAHLLNDHPTVYFACQTCRERFANPSELKSHNDKKHDLKEDQVRLSNVNQDKESYSCKECDRIFLIENSFKEHSCKKEKPLPAINTKRPVPVVIERPRPMTEVASRPEAVDPEAVFYSRVTRNVRENLLHHLDGKLTGGKPEGGGAEEAGSCATPTASQRTFLTFSAGHSGGGRAGASGGVAKDEESGVRSRPIVEKYYFPKNYDGRCGLTSYIKDTSYLDISTQLIMRRNLQRLNMLPLRGEEEREGGREVPEVLALLERQETDCAESYCGQSSPSLAPGAAATPSPLPGTTAPSPAPGAAVPSSVSEAAAASSSTEDCLGSLSGEWVRERLYVCSACSWESPCLWTMEDHKYFSHPRIHCPQYELVGDQVSLSKIIYNRLSEIPPPYHPEEQPAPSPPPLSAVHCTKCRRTGFDSSHQLHAHILDCAGVIVEPFNRPSVSSRRSRRRKRRRPRRGLKRNIPSTPQKPPAKPRSKPGDSDSIQKMIANLPAKRVSRKVFASYEDRLTRRGWGGQQKESSVVVQSTGARDPPAATSSRGGGNNNRGKKKTVVTKTEEGEKSPPGQQPAQPRARKPTIMMKEQDYIDTSAEGGDVLSSLRMMPVRAHRVSLEAAAALLTVKQEEVVAEEKEMPKLEVEKDIPPVVESTEIPVLSPVEGKSAEIKDGTREDLILGITFIDGVLKYETVSSVLEETSVLEEDPSVVKKRKRLETVAPPEKKIKQEEEQVVPKRRGRPPKSKNRRNHVVRRRSQRFAVSQEERMASLDEIVPFAEEVEASKISQPRQRKPRKRNSAARSLPDDTLTTSGASTIVVKAEVHPEPTAKRKFTPEDPPEETVEIKQEPVPLNEPEFKKIKIEQDSVEEIGDNGECGPQNEEKMGLPLCIVEWEDCVSNTDVKEKLDASDDVIVEIKYEEEPRNQEQNETVGDENRSVQSTEVLGVVEEVSAEGRPETEKCLVASEEKSAESKRKKRPKKGLAKRKVEDSRYQQEEDKGEIKTEATISAVVEKVKKKPKNDLLKKKKKEELKMLKKKLMLRKMKKLKKKQRIASRRGSNDVLESGSGQFVHFAGFKWEVSELELPPVEDLGTNGDVAGIVGSAGEPISEQSEGELTLEQAAGAVVQPTALVAQEPSSSAPVAHLPLSVADQPPAIGPKLPLLLAEQLPSVVQPPSSTVPSPPLPVSVQLAANVSANPSVQPTSYPQPPTSSSDPQPSNVVAQQQHPVAPQLLATFPQPQPPVAAQLQATVSQPEVAAQLPATVGLPQPPVTSQLPPLAAHPPATVAQLQPSVTSQLPPLAAHRPATVAQPQPSVTPHIFPLAVQLPATIAQPSPLAATLSTPPRQIATPAEPSSLALPPPVAPRPPVYSPPLNQPSPLFPLALDDSLRWDRCDRWPTTAVPTPCSTSEDSTSLGTIIDSVNKLLNEPDSSYNPLGLPSYSLADLQKAMGASDDEMAVLQQLGEASLQVEEAPFLEAPDLCSLEPVIRTAEKLDSTDQEEDWSERAATCHLIDLDHQGLEEGEKRPLAVGACASLQGPSVAVGGLCASSQQEPMGSLYVSPQRSSAAVGPHFTIHQESSMVVGGPCASSHGPSVTMGAQPPSLHANPAASVAANRRRRISLSVKDNRSTLPCRGPSEPATSSSSSSSLLAAHRGKEVLCPSCSCHFMGFPNLQKHLAKKHRNSSVNGGVGLGTGGGYATGAGRRVVNLDTLQGPRLICYECGQIEPNERMAAHISLEHSHSPLNVANCTPINGDDEGPVIGEKLRSKMSSALGDLLDRAVNNLLTAKTKNNSLSGGGIDLLSKLCAIRKREGSEKHRLHGARELLIKLNQEQQSVGGESGSGTEEKGKVVSRRSSAEGQQGASSRRGRSTNSKPFSCSVCPLKFVLAFSRDKHEMCAHKTPTKADLATITSDLNFDVYQFDDDWRRSPSPSNRNFTDGIISPQCSDCGLGFESLSEMMQHRLEDHTTPISLTDPSGTTVDPPLLNPIPPQDPGANNTTLEQPGPPGSGKHHPNTIPTVWRRGRGRGRGRGRRGRGKPRQPPTAEPPSAAAESPSATVESTPAVELPPSGVTEPPLVLPSAAVKRPNARGTRSKRGRRRP